jgi:(5-formylfuran-3-yl)methyl phosphate synthase
MPGPQLLVSVRDATEAEAAVAGGAGLVDVKEPTRGPLGRADAATIAAVIRAVRGRAPVSAALGELRDCPLAGLAADLPMGLSFVKWGLSELAGATWPRLLLNARYYVPIRAVAVAYADAARIHAPSPAAVVDFARRYARRSRVRAVLFDTFHKDGSTLLDWLPLDDLTALVTACRRSGVTVALAGSLTATTIGRLRDLRPDWFAVRGAACDGGRDGGVCEHRVRELATLVRSFGQL